MAALGIGSATPTSGGAVLATAGDFDAFEWGNGWAAAATRLVFLDQRN